MERQPPIRKTMAIPRLSREPSPPELVPFVQLLSGHQAGLLLVIRDATTRIGRDEQCGVALDEIGVSRIHASILRTESGFEILDEDSTNGTFVNDQQVFRLSLKDGDRINLGPSCTLKFGLQPQAEVELAQRLFEGARLDSLTGLFNRATVFERLKQEMSYSERQGLPFCLLLFDIDHFKKVNDSYGHPAGDKVLCDVASRARRLLRLEDTLGRYGGEEFIILMRGSELPDALRAAERLRLEIADKPFEIDDQLAIEVTLSIGVSSWKPGCSQEQLIEKADQALYQAKGGGRNQVRQAPN